MRRWIFLMLVFLAAACVSQTPQPLPPIAENLPSDVAAAETLFDKRVQSAYPVGSSEKDAISSLEAAGFQVGPRVAAGLRSAEIKRDGSVCRTIWSVRWTAEAGTLREVRGVYGLQCL